MVKRKKSIDPVRGYKGKAKAQDRRTSNGVEEELYKKVSTNDLILFSIYSVMAKKEKRTFERLVKECFILFPKSFSFSRISKWPDSRKLDRPLRTLRKRRLITGDPKSFFSLTKLGRKTAEETAKVFRQRKLKL